MQLISVSVSSISIATQVASAALALLSPAVGRLNASEVTSPLVVDTRLMYYSETDRVSAFEAVLSGKYRLSAEQILSGKVVFDSLTGSSPNGAIPTNSVQTFTTPSGNATYQTQAGKMPLDATFRDTRVALDLNYSAPLSTEVIYNVGLSGSNEYDYLSLGVTAGLAVDLFDKNVTLSTQLSFFQDTISPEGGIPLGLVLIPQFPSTKPISGDSEDKQITDVLIGWTQVLSPKSLFKTNLVIGYESGYLNDPFKLLSVTNEISGELTGDPNQRYITEKRPDSRLRVAWYTAYQHQFGEDVFRAAYRFYADDWGVQSHTLDLWYRYQLNPRHFIEPHLRGYLQTAADFYNTSLVESEAIGVGRLSEASADSRLGDFMAYTLGFTYGYDMTNHQELRFTAEYYLQQSDPSRSIGVQNQQTLIEDLTAISVRLGYQYSW